MLAKEVDVVDQTVVQNVRDLPALLVASSQQRTLIGLRAAREIK